MQKTQKAEVETFDASNCKVGIALAQFNSHITEKLYNGARRRAKEYGIAPDSIDTLRVAGSVELPLALQHLAESKNYNALLAIGCVIRGDTAHFDYVCKFACEGILRVQLDYKIPIGFGVLTCDSEEQALQRTNLGAEYMDAALQLAKALGNLRKAG